MAPDPPGGGGNGAARRTADNDARSSAASPDKRAMFAKLKPPDGETPNATTAVARRPLPPGLLPATRALTRAA